MPYQQSLPFSSLTFFSTLYACPIRFMEEQNLQDQNNQELAIGGPHGGAEHEDHRSLSKWRSSQGMSRT